MEFSLLVNLNSQCTITQLSQACSKITLKSDWMNQSWIWALLLKYTCTCTWVIQKVSGFLKNFLHFRQSVLFEILGPSVFDYEDSKSEFSWHSAKKIREVFLDYKSPPPLLFVYKYCDFISRSSCTNKKLFKTVKREKFLKILLEKSRFYLLCIEIL